VKVVVIGSTGQLGQDLMRVFGETAVGLGHQDLDVTDGIGVVMALQELQPDWVLNTAAYHRVDDCENNPTLTFAVNAVGASNVARAAAAVGAGVVFFSTDYVFGGETRGRGHPHSEADRPQPLNVYGVSKLAGERLVMLGNRRHLVLRSAGLYGTATSRKGWTFPELMINKACAGEQLRVVDDQALSPTYTADLAAKVKELVEQDVVGLFHVTNAGECSWFEFACATLSLAGLDTKIEPIATVTSQRRAQRPPYSALSSICLGECGLNPLRSWKEALKAYLQAKAVI
jgi:dTDP-4-dehydrorhamnose reductase